MQWLASISVKRPVFATVIILSLTVVGAFSFGRLGLDRFPKVDFPTVVVTTRLPGAAPEEVETEITDKIEEAVNTISGIDELRSTSSEGVSQVIVAFLLEKDADIAAQEVRDRVNRVLPLLPKTIEQPTVEKFDPDSAPVLTLAVSANKPIRDITEYADKTLRRQLENVNGVGQVVVDRRTLAADQHAGSTPARLQAYNLTVTDVSRALQTQNAEIPGGRIEQGGDRADAAHPRPRPVGRRSSATSSSSSARGTPILLRDVARVEDGMAEPLTRANKDGEPTVLVTVRRQSGTNTVQVVESVKERLADIASTVPAGYDIRVVRDMSEFIKASIKSVEEHLIVGSILAALVVLVFLWNWRSTDHRRDRDPDVDHRDLRPDLVSGLHAELDDDAGAHARGRHRHRRCDRGAGEHLPLRRGEGAAAGAGGDRGDARDRPRGARDHAVAGGDLHPGRLHGRHRRPVHDQLRLHDGVRDPGVDAGQLHADADAGGALDQDEAAARGCRGARDRRGDRPRTRDSSGRSISGYTPAAAVVARPPLGGRRHRGAGAARAACRCS